jgi:hypothetical protein
VLVDGFVAGTWRIDVGRDGSAPLMIRLFTGLSPADHADVEAEAARVAAFLAPLARHREIKISEGAAD